MRGGKQGRLRRLHADKGETPTPTLTPTLTPTPTPTLTLAPTLTKATGFCWLKNSSYTAAAQNRSKGLISGRMASDMPAASAKASAKVPKR